MTRRSKPRRIKHPRPASPKRPPTSARSWSSVRESYDTVAAEYARRISGELAYKPSDREWLDHFSEGVRHLGRVCDLGCGPGHVARYLRDRGVDVFGLDLSPGMLGEARRLNPDIEFIEGTMLCLDSAAETLGGIGALYSIIHLNRRQLAAAFCEMLRVLRPGGCALIAFHVGSKTIRHRELWGYSVDLSATFFTTREIVRKLERAGFRIEAAAERDPYPDVEYQSRRGYIIASKPLAPKKRKVTRR